MLMNVAGVVFPDLEAESVSVHATGGGDHGVDDVGGEGSNEGGERTANDDGNGQLDHVAAKYEVLETLEHGWSSDWVRVSGSAEIKLHSGVSGGLSQGCARALI